MKDGWLKCELHEHIRLIDYRGRTPKKTESGVKLITAKNVKLGFLQEHPQEFIAEDNYDDWMRRGIPEYGDVIFTTEAPLANVAQLLTKEKVAFAQRTIVMQPDTSVLNKTFLKYLLLSPEIRKDIFSNGTGATVTGIKSSLLKKIPILIPPLPEQKQIVALLDKAFAAMEQAKANIEKNIANAKELFQSKLNDIFSQKGDGWEEKTLGKVCENLDSKRIPISKSKRNPGKIPYYGASGIVDYVANYLFDEDLLLVSEDGANLLARTYPIAFSISGKNWVNNHAHVLRFENLTSQIFIEYYLNSIKLDEYISGMAQPKLNQRKLNSIKVPFPSIEKQEKTISMLKELEDLKIEIESHYQQKLTNLEDLKKSILQKAFSGELSRKDLIREELKPEIV